MSRRRLVQIMLGLAALEGAAVGAATLLWGTWGLAGALAVVLAVGDMPFSWLLDRCIPARVGGAALAGARGKAACNFHSPGDPAESRGRVRVQGALWSARLETGAARTPRDGEMVRIRTLEGLTLVVAPEADGEEQTAGHQPGPAEPE